VRCASDRGGACATISSIRAAKEVPPSPLRAASARFVVADRSWSTEQSCELRFSAACCNPSAAAGVAMLDTRCGVAGQRLDELLATHEDAPQYDGALSLGTTHAPEVALHSWASQDLRLRRGQL
jgi:hypothetical protein